MTYLIQDFQKVNISPDSKIHRGIDKIKRHGLKSNSSLLNLSKIMGFLQNEINSTDSLFVIRLTINLMRIISSTTAVCTNNKI